MRATTVFERLECVDWGLDWLTKSLSNQKGTISATVCRWHMRILLCIPVARILWDFYFLRGLAPGRLDGFSIGRYEKKRECFDFHAAKFKSGAMRFWGENSPRRWNPFKTRSPPLYSYYKGQSTANSKSFKIVKKTAFEAKGRLYTTGKVIPRLFIIDLHTQLAIYGYRWGKREI